MNADELCSSVFPDQNIGNTKEQNLGKRKNAYYLNVVTISVYPRFYFESFLVSSSGLRISSSNTVTIRLEKMARFRNSAK